MSAAFVVRSLHPERTAPAIRAAKDSRAAARLAALDWAEKRWPNLAPRSYDHFDGSFNISGFSAKSGMTHAVEVPDGMRYDRKYREIVPAKRTDEGRAIAKEMAERGYTYPHIDGLGGIVTIGDGERHYFSGWTFFVFDQSDGGVTVFAALGRPELLEGPALHVIEKGDAWVTAPLSEFHVAQEDHERRAAS